MVTIREILKQFNVDLDLSSGVLDMELYYDFKNYHTEYNNDLNCLQHVFEGTSKKDSLGFDCCSLVIRPSKTYGHIAWSRYGVNYGACELYDREGNFLSHN